MTRLPGYTLYYFHLLSEYINFSLSVYHYGLTVFKFYVCSFNHSHYSPFSGQIVSALVGGNSFLGWLLCPFDSDPLIFENVLAF